MFDWFKNRRRQRVIRAPAPDFWGELVDRHLWQFAGLTANEQTQLRETAAVIVAEKNWEGCDGFIVTESVKWITAAQIALTTLGLDRQFFDRVLSILLYPDAYQAKSQESPGSGMVIEGEETLLGQAWYRGPVILTWPDVLAAGRGPNRGQHLVAHEFAHQLDMLNGRSADGIPPMKSNQQAERWIEIVERDYTRLCHDCQHGPRPLLDCYGATNKAEFFAVASEAFFQKPAALAARHAELFDAMSEYYGQDPRRWER